ncbi:MAG: cytochrome c [Thermodesulfobacteriota bacterium]
MHDDPTPTPARAARLRTCVRALATAALLAGTPPLALADDHGKELPAGPIRDRHELMEGVGADAKAIGAATKAGKPADAVKPAQEIAAALEKFPTLFPEGSQSPLSRARPEVWSNKKKFDELAADARAKALALAEAAKSGGDLKAASGALFKNCKACHDDFRVPEEGE